MTTAEEFVSKVLFARDVAHLAHWRTESFSQHMALGEFYDAILDLIDGFVEQYQGYYEKLMAVERASGTGVEDARKLLETQYEWIEVNRYKVCDKDDTALQNTIDEIVRQYQHTIYKLRFLK